MELWVPGSRLERVGDERLDPDRVEALWVAPGTRLLSVTADARLPVDAAGGLRFGPASGAYDTQRHFLVGEVDGAAVFAREAAVEPPAVLGRFAMVALDDTARDIAATALALVNWHRVAPHCGVCGALTTVRKGGNMRHCDACGRDRFPRTDPAVITAILDAEGRLLLAHNAAWEAARMSLVAGFVSAGESLEACVRRETFEEVGVRLGEVRYVSSQPWPFPRSLMLGFVARAASAEVAVDGVEIDRARFFSRAEHAAALADGSLLTPASASIAASLIGLWGRGELDV